MKLNKENEIKAVGVLTQTEKEQYWKDTYSGSQMNTLIHNERQLYEQKQNEKKIKFSADVMRAMEMGNIMEPVIVEQFKQRIEGATIETDKNTYVSTNNPMFSANVDGFITLDSHPNEKGIFEAKCVKEGSPETIYKSYKPQIQFYMWFFGMKYAVLGMLVKSTDSFHFMKIDYDESYVEWMFEKLIDFVDCLAKGTAPKLKFDPAKTISADDHPEIGKLFEKLFQAKEQKTKWKKLEEEIKKELKTKMSKDVSYFNDKDYIYKKNSYPKTTVDYKLFKKEMEKKHNKGLVFNNFNEIYGKTTNVFYWKKHPKK